MTIDPNDPRITAYVFDELSPQDRAGFELELSGSPELQSLVDKTRKTVAVLESDLAAAPPSQLHPPQREAVRREIEQGAASTKDVAGAAARPQPPIKGGPRRRLPAWPLAAACSALLLLGLGAVGAMLFVSVEERGVALSDNSFSQVQSIRSDDLHANADSSAAPGRADVELYAMERELSELTAPQAEGQMPQDKSIAPRPSSSPFVTHPAAPAPDAPAPTDRLTTDLGTGPQSPGDQFDPITENPFQRVRQAPLSTFSIDVDTASYSKVRMFLQNGRLPRPAAVRLEEMINYFRYKYEPPEEDGETPFASHLAVTECPWAPKHRLVRIALKGRTFESQQRPDANLVFLIDVSGSMNQPNKLPLLKRGMKMLANQLRDNDRVAIVVYAGAAGLVLDSTPGDRKGEILAALDRLRAGGSTNGGAGIRLAYQTALDHFLTEGVNRVILCSDGDFNVGTTGADQLVELAAENAKTGVFLSVLGFGMGNHNDAMMERVSNRGNGNYAFIDNDAEAAKVLVEQMDSTLVTIAKDVKIQVEFNPQQVEAYRMLGYENRRLATEDFDDDKKDAGEIGAGHEVTMLYEIVPAGAETDAPLPPAGRELKYQRPAAPSDAADSDELLTVWLRYKQPDGDTSTKLGFPLQDQVLKFGEADQDFRFAAAVASFGMLLRNSPYGGDANYDAVLEIAGEAADDDPLRRELLELVRQARALSR